MRAGQVERALVVGAGGFTKATTPLKRERANCNFDCLLVCHRNERQQCGLQPQQKTTPLSDRLGPSTSLGSRPAKLMLRLLRWRQGALLFWMLHCAPKSAPKAVAKNVTKSN